jgi:hypothetical protein
MTGEGLRAPAEWQAKGLRAPVEEQAISCHTGVSCSPEGQSDEKQRRPNKE